MTDNDRWRMLRQLLGFVENGSSNGVTISQDDATRDWVIAVGMRCYVDQSLDAALKMAVKESQI